MKKYKLKRNIIEFVRKLTTKNKFVNSLYTGLSKIKHQRYKKLDDIEFFKRRYKYYIGKELNLDNPSTYNEKLIWLQLYDRNPLYTKLADKYLVKQYVSELIGEKYVSELIGVWENADKIPFENLPEEYVLKCNHDCGSVFIKKKDTKVNKKKLIKKFNKALSRNYYDVGRVWSYKNIKPLIFCESLVQTHDNKPPKDYKFFCFDGVPKFLFVASDRGENTKFDFYDMNWNRIPVKQHFPNSTIEQPKPKQFEEMIELSKILSKGLPHVRVDFYIDKFDKIIFGEMTFCHFSGKEPFEPDKYDKIFGSYLKLPLSEE